MSLQALAQAGGLATRWKDVHNQWHDVGDDTLRLILAALGLPADTDRAVADSLASLRHPAHLPPLVTGEAGGELTLPGLTGAWQIVLEHGGTQDGVDNPVRLPAAPGYHTLRTSGGRLTLAVAPPRCWTVADAIPEGSAGRAWGLAAQIYSLRRPGDGGLGDYGALADLVRNAAAHGAAAVAISPAHAQFSATHDRFSPYSPSSRTALNVLHARLDLPTAQAAVLEAEPLVDWPAATRLRLDALDALFAQAERDGGTLWDAFQRFRTEQSRAVEGHARFEALHSHIFGNGGPWHWRQWPDGLADAGSAAVARFAEQHAREVTRLAFHQFIADRSLGDAQAAAKQAGMAIGLISDLAVGVDSGGSQCWSSPDQVLIGLNVGAPPDLMNTRGQSWGLSAFSPRGLQLNGFGVFIDMLRSAMHHAGGVRIDHAMGLARLWMLPDGASAADGAYLHFPVDDMLRLVRLESLRNRAVVLGEDLGTLPDGFQDRISTAGVLGMRVLWFERAMDQGFTAPTGWDRGAASMTSTHDLPTVAGWWSGHDTGWRHRLGLLDADGVAREGGERHRDRHLLWAAMRASGAAQGDPPPPDAPAAAVDAAIRHVGLAACELTIVPLEDALGLVEQPNLPGTLDEHPNWRRRLPGPAGALLDDPAAAARLRDLEDARKRR